MLSTCALYVKLSCTYLLSQEYSSIFAQLQKPYNIRESLSRPIATDVAFAVFFVLTFALYLPAARAGFVADFTGWLDQTIHYGFWDNINRTHYSVKSLYQFTQLNTWLFYQVAGAHPWPWHLLFVSLHAINCALLYRLCLRLLADSAVASASVIALVGAILYCITPYAGEVVVWEPSFHYLQGMLLILLILNWLQSYLHTLKSKYVIYIAIAFLLSTFSLEIFYITPWLALSLGIFYRLNDSFDRGVLKKTLLFVFLPQVVMFVLHLVIFRLHYGTWVAHIGTGAVSTALQDGLGKPAKHLFHTLLLGRFWGEGMRSQVYKLLDSTAATAIFYALVLLAAYYIISKFRQMAGKGRVISLLFLWTMICLALLVPIWFGNEMLIIYDRYTYFANAFVYMLLVLLISFVSVAAIRISLVALYALVNLRFTIQVSRYWMKSERIISSLLSTFPATGKKVILLNLPQTMHGAAMIGAEQESEFKMLHNGLYPGKAITTPVYDAMAYNVVTPDDGAHVTVLNDSTVRVTLNQWGTWWWYAMHGGCSYANSEYTLNLIDGGHMYELTLKHQAQDYLLLYQQGNHWKTVDMSKKNVEQY